MPPIIIITISNIKHRNINRMPTIWQRGIEFGQTTYPAIKPTKDLNEFKVETQFSILEALSIEGMPDEFTPYGFTNERLKH